MGDAVAEIRQVARERFGYDGLRAGQEEAIAAVLEGRDVLAVMATGHGKSAIYQIAGLLIDGPTLVISPLLALQRDQVEDLDVAAMGGAAAVSSHVTETERREALRDAQLDELEFLFMAPEQLTKPEVLEQVRAAGPSLMVVDEAHCIAEWGHDFRPDFLRLGVIAEAIGRPPVLALTATAAPPVRDEILRRLELRDPHVVIKGFNRPDIHLAVERHYDEHHKRAALVEHVRALPGPGIVYAATRAVTEELADLLAAEGIAAAAYHGGLPRARREEVQNAFMEDRIAVVVATTAFGMGVDKANVRFVIHHAIPDSVDSYWQEVGRAGRDGRPARAVLLYRAEDVGLRRFFAGSGHVEAVQIEEVARVVDEHGGAVAPHEIKDETELTESKLITAVGRLEEAGAIEVLSDGLIASTGETDLVVEAVEEATELQEARESFDRSRVDMIRGLAELGRGCRREYVLAYFGEPFEAPCGACDLCDEGRAGEVGEVPFPVGSRVVHEKWGEATVQRYEENKVSLLFDSVGYKALGLDVVAERDLLRPA